jgi:hypothetical protein
LASTSCQAPRLAVLRSIDPDFETGGAAILALESDRGLELWVPDSGEDPIMPAFRLEPGHPATLYWLSFADSLATLGVKPGLLQETSGDDSHVLPRPRNVWSSAWDGTRSSAWAPSGLIDALRTLRVPGLVVEPCPVFESKNVTLPTAGSVAWLAPVSMREGLLYTGSAMFLVATDGTVRSATTSMRGHLSDAAPDAGSLLLAGEAGLYRGRLNGVLLELELLIPQPGLLALSATTAGDRHVVFAASREALYRSESGAPFQRLGGLPPPHQWIQVAALGPDSVVVSIDEAPSFYIYEGGKLELGPDFGRSGSFLSAAVIPGLGPVVGTSVGLIAVRQGTTWMSLGDTQLAGAVFQMVPYGGGFAYGSDAATIGTWRPNGGFCPPQQAAVRPVNRVLALGDTLLLGQGDLPASHDGVVTIAHPKP